MTQKFISMLIFAFSLTNTFGQAEKPKLSIAHLTGDFYIYTTYNTYKGSQVPANGMYLVTDSGVALFDTPWDTTQFQPLLDSIKIKHNKDVVLCIATHSHEDRTAGLDFLKQKGVKTYTTEQTDNICKANGQKRAQYVTRKDTTFQVGQHTFQTYYGGQGHTPDNIVIWFDKEKILYGGCLIKSTEAEDLGNLADANVNEWPSTIRHIQKKFKKPTFIIPGHNDWKSNESLTHTLNLIKQYEAKNADKKVLMTQTLPVQVAVPSAPAFIPEI